ncbi:MAG: Gfo/Idh/MocA family oxidoreductase [Ignavibacteria bacterium]|nr:Gfo/Idh/MocA family oxidoreductase [Ignavibacteria bacterium]
MKTKIRWGIIGCGDVTEVKSGPGFQKAEHSELVAVMRRNGKLAEDYARRHNVPKWYDDAYKLINDPDVDAVYIATPPSTHKEYTLAVASAKKPVYVEKPMALNYNECIEMVDACKKFNVPLFVAYYRRALPRFLKIKSLLQDGTIGNVQAVNIRFFQKPSESDINKTYNWHVDPSIAGCGYFCDLGCHMIDLIQFFLGKITEASGYNSNQSKLYLVEDTVTAAFKFESGILGSGVWSFASYQNLDETEIAGSKGKIVYSTFSNEPVKLFTDYKTEEIIIDHPPHVAQPLIQLVVNDLSGTGTCPSTGETGAHTSFVMDKILGRI